MNANGVLPADIAAVWGSSPLARDLVEAWGLGRFRGSAIHQLALIEERHATEKRTAQDDFRKRDHKAIREKP